MEKKESDACSIRTFCQTRWTVRADSLAAILENYQVLQMLWEETTITTSDTDMKARIRGIASQMETFQYLFSLILSEMILRHTDKLSYTLPNPELSSTQAHELAMLTVKTLQSIHSDENFDIFWQKVDRQREKLCIDDAQLPRKRKLPRRYEHGDAVAEFHTLPKAFYRQVYFEAIDLAVSSICSRFDQPGYKVYSTVEQMHALEKTMRICSLWCVDSMVMILIEGNWKHTVNTYDFIYREN